MHRVVVAAALIASHAVGQDPPAKQEAKEILLQVHWRVEQSTVKIVMETRWGGVVSTLDQTKVEYDEHVLEVGAGLRRKVRRTYKKYEHVESERGIPVPRALAGQTFTFVRRDGYLRATKPLPWREPKRVGDLIAAADWEELLPGRVVRIGEQWETAWGHLGESARLRYWWTRHVGRRLRLTLKAIKGNIAVIAVEREQYSKPDDAGKSKASWQSVGTMQFSKAHRKIVRTEWKVPSRLWQITFSTVRELKHQKPRSR